MKSVIENEYNMEIKNSKFISLIFQINQKEEINKCLNRTKEKYPNATHYCYAYILEQEKYASDDGEPSGTAGIPILLVLEKQKLNHVLCIVVRYFGKIKLGAGEKIAKVGIKFSKEGLTGFEEISGIPGTIGGAVRMNAGAHGREMKDVIKTVKCLDYHGNEKTFTNEEMNFGYRTSILKTEKYIVTEVEIELDKGNSEEIKEKMDMYKEKRKNSQPLEYPSAGSTFKRGEDFITAKLIDEAGLKGTKVGDAEVSRKHGGFIINKGNATASDILELVQIIKNKIYEKYQKKIELEVEVLGEE